MKKLFQSDWVSRFIDALLPVFATLAALLVGAVMLLFLKVNPIQAYRALWDGAFGTSNAFAETLVKATPLLLVGHWHLYLVPRGCDQYWRRRANDHRCALCNLGWINLHKSARAGL